MRSLAAMALLTFVLGIPAIGWAALCDDLSGPADIENFAGFNTGPLPGTGTSFDVTTADGTATFSGDQWVGVAGVPELYRPGDNVAWMVNPTDAMVLGGEDGIGIITFDPPAAEVKFYARTRSVSTGTTAITSFDASDQMIDAVELPAGMSAFQAVCLTGAIGSIEFVNNDIAQMNGIDDFAFIVPEPSSSAAALGGLSVLLSFGIRRRKTA